MIDIDIFRAPTRTETRLVPFEKTVIEKRAPTDDSIRLFKEMTEKAEQNMLDAFVIKSSVFTEAAVAVYRRISADSFGIPLVARYKFKLNNIPITGEIIVEEDMYSKGDYRRFLADEVYNRFIEEVSRELFKSYANTLMIEGKYIS